MVQPGEARTSVTPTSALTVKSVEALAGSGTRFAHAIKAGPWIFLNGHEAFDFERGLAPEVEGPPGSRLSGRPPLRREADYILQRMRSTLKEFGADLANAVRVDQYYTSGQAVHAYHLARFAEFGSYIPPSTSIIMPRCFTQRTNIHTCMIAVAPGKNWVIEKIALPGEAISASGYSPAVVVNDFVFVAGNQAFVASGELGPGVAMAPACNWGGENAFRRQAHYVIRERLAPSLKAAGSALERSLKAQVYVRGVDNFPDFIDVWSQYFRDIPCALTLVPAKDYSSTESMLEINLIALKTGATRRKEVVEVDIPALATYGPCLRAGGAGPRRLAPCLRAGRLRGRRRRHGQRRARAILPDRYSRFRRRRRRLVGPLRTRAAPVCRRAGARPATDEWRHGRRRLLDLRGVTRRLRARRCRLD